MKLPARPKLDLGCTLARHRRIGIDAVVNARGSQQWRNDDTLDEIERKRDARKVRDRIASRAAFYQFGSRFFRRHLRRFKHLISSYNE